MSLRFIKDYQIPKIYKDDILLIDVQITTCTFQSSVFREFRPIIDRQNLNNFIFSVPNKKILILDDLHFWSFQGRSYDSLKEYCFDNKINDVITYVDSNDEVEIISKFLHPIKISKVTWYFNPAIFNDWRLPKIYDIIFYGAISDVHYPLRHKLINLLQTPKFKNSFKIKIINYDERINGQQLSQLINQSWLGVSTKSQYNYLVKKYFEISASKCFLIGDMATQGLSIFDSDSYLNLTMMSDDQIYDSISHILQDKKALQQRIDKNYQLVHSQFTEQKVFEKIKSICHQR